MKDLYTRTIWGFLFVVGLTGAIFLGKFTFAALFLVFTVLSLLEFYTICHKAGYAPQTIPGTLLGMALFVISFLGAQNLIHTDLYRSLILLTVWLPVIALFQKKSNPLLNSALTIFGVLYVALPFALMNYLAFQAESTPEGYQPYLLMSLFIFVWVSDSGAYLFGVNFGKHRMFERISPKKSWEGFVGGLLTAMVSALLLHKWLPNYSGLQMQLLAISVVIAGTIGDLVESMIKREIGIKDSGNFLPGHGGLLDRFDSILLATPTIYFIIQFFN